MAVVEAVSVERQRAARGVLFVEGDPLGIDPGDFAVRLMRAVVAADEDNRTLLGTVFPDLVWARLEFHKAGGHDRLRAIALQIPDLAKAWADTGKKLDTLAGQVQR